MLLMHILADFRFTAARSSLRRAAICDPHPLAVLVRRSPRGISSRAFAAHVSGCDANPLLCGSLRRDADDLRPRAAADSEAPRHRGAQPLGAQSLSARLATGQRAIVRNHW